MVQCLISLNLEMLLGLIGVLCLGSSGSLSNMMEPPIPEIGAHWKDSPTKVPALRLRGNVPSHMLDVNDSWNASPSIEV